MKVLDLFCGAGGAAVGIKRAWPDAEITGVDIAPQPRYPFTFVEADATTYPLDGYDFIWASPPCQRYSRATVQQRQAGVEYLDCIDALRSALSGLGVPYVIENVPLAPLLAPVMLCGQMFGLRVLRHRLFEANFAIQQPPHKSHAGLQRGVGKDFVCAVINAWKKGEHKDDGVLTWREAMDIDWMTKRELSQAVPPAYAEYVCSRLDL